jgi:hypothetical protein
MAGGRLMRRAEDWEGSLSDLIQGYRYQPKLTKRLDALGPALFTQEVINDIVLWKVNRYVNPIPAALTGLNGVAGFQPKSHRNASGVLATLLNGPGVDLAMASTFLRFRNRKAFQIIDRHAYRAVYGEEYPLYPSSSVGVKTDTYFDYLDRLFELAELKGLDFELLDRILYVFDKEVNGKL